MGRSVAWSPASPATSGTRGATAGLPKLKEARIPIGASLEEAERIMMLKTLAFTNGDVKKAAAILGCTQKKLKDSVASTIK